jgi:hypothetical protein
MGAVVLSPTPLLISRFLGGCDVSFHKLNELFLLLLPMSFSQFTALRRDFDLILRVCFNLFLFPGAFQQPLEIEITEIVVYLLYFLFTQQRDPCLIGVHTHHNRLHEIPKPADLHVTVLGLSPLTVIIVVAG